MLYSELRTRFYVPHLLLCPSDLSSFRLRRPVFVRFFASACRRCSPRVLFVQTIDVDVPIEATAAVRASCPGGGRGRTERPGT